MYGLDLHQPRARTTLSTTVKYGIPQSTYMNCEIQQDRRSMRRPKRTSPVRSASHSFCAWVELKKKWSVANLLRGLILSPSTSTWHSTENTDELQNRTRSTLHAKIQRPLHLLIRLISQLICSPAWRIQIIPHTKFSPFTNLLSVWTLTMKWPNSRGLIYSYYTV